MNSKEPVFWIFDGSLLNCWQISWVDKRMIIELKCQQNCSFWNRMKIAAINSIPDKSESVVIMVKRNNSRMRTEKHDRKKKKNCSNTVNVCRANECIQQNLNGVRAYWSIWVLRVFVVMFDILEIALQNIPRFSCFAYKCDVNFFLISHIKCNDAPLICWNSMFSAKPNRLSNAWK